jgi:hypothetical protein
MESESSWAPQLPPMAHAPNPTSDTLIEELPNFRYFIVGSFFKQYVDGNEPLFHGY